MARNSIFVISIILAAMTMSSCRTTSGDTSDATAVAVATDFGYEEIYFYRHQTDVYGVTDPESFCWYSFMEKVSDGTTSYYGRVGKSRNRKPMFKGGFNNGYAIANCGKPQASNSDKEVCSILDDMTTQFRHETGGFKVGVSIEAGTTFRKFLDTFNGETSRPCLPEAAL